GRVHVGDRLWKTSDPELDRRLRQSFEGETARFQRPLQMEVHGLASQPLTLIARDEQGHVVQLDSAVLLAEAHKQPMTTERLRHQLGRLGGTAFKLGELKNLLQGDVLLPMSELNRLRREVVLELESLRARPKRWTLIESNSQQQALAFKLAAQANRSDKERRLLALAAARAELIVLVRNLTQLKAALQCGVETIYCEFEDPKGYRESVAMVRQLQLAIGNRQLAIFVAPPRIFKMGEEWTLKQVRSCEADGYLVRNYD